MKTYISFIFITLLTISNLEAKMLHQTSSIQQEWKEEHLDPFNELILTWNATRPIDGKLNFYVSIKTNDWSPWLLYASWGSDGQSSFQNQCLETSVKLYQDAIEVTKDKATAFQIKITSEGSASINNIHSLHVYINGDKDSEIQELTQNFSSIYIKIPGLSQMTLDHARHKHLCSPTSTTAVTRYFSNNHTIDPVDFAQNAWDSGFDIYGNWVFNVVQASTILGKEWNCWVERLNGFNHLYTHLSSGNPVVVSIRGPLPGSAQAYSQGHLLVVVGYDPLHKQVICMDPAFPSDEETNVSYELNDFIEAWNRRGKIAYIFSKNES
ncbi:MAG: C39 family peptidase [Parachlamydiaceae bacterium]|nr:C39 family peptidase [Parachlamydiaceae bacterium]